MQDHPIFDDVRWGDLEAVKQHVLADPAVLEEKYSYFQMTPLIYAIYYRQPSITNWLIEHRGQHDVNTRGGLEMTALHWACDRGLLSIVEALVASRADPSVTDAILSTPLMEASNMGYSDIVAYLLRLPAVRATVDTVHQYGHTTLSFASRHGHASCVQLLLDAGADPIIPAGAQSPRNLALSQGHTAIAALLRHAIAKPDRARALHKARALLDAAIVINNARQDALDDGHAPVVQKQAAIAAVPVYLQGRLQQRDDEALPLPVPELTPQRGDERVRATVAFVLGLEEGGVAYAGLPRGVYKELLGYMMHAWADKGPEGQGGQA